MFPSSVVIILITWCHFKKRLLGECTTSCPSLIHRGTTGFDNSRRDYFANHQGQRPPLTREPYPSTDPYEQTHRPHPSQTDLYNPQSSNSQYTTPRISPEFYQGKPAQSPHVQTVTSGAAIGVVDNSPAKDKTNSNKEIDDKEKAR